MNTRHSECVYRASYDPRPCVLVPQLGFWARIFWILGLLLWDEDFSYGKDPRLKNFVRLMQETATTLVSLEAASFRLRDPFVLSSGRFTEYIGGDQCLCT